jgi:hypothetical protein
MSITYPWYGHEPIKRLVTDAISNSPVGYVPVKLRCEGRKLGSGTPCWGIHIHILILILTLHIPSKLLLSFFMKGRHHAYDMSGSGVHQEKPLGYIALYSTI